MATLKHVQDSMQSEVSEEKQSFIIESEEPVTIPTLNGVEYVVFKLVTRRKNLYIDGICYDILNPKTKQNDNAWLIRGAVSIWESDLKDIVKDIDKPNSKINKNRMSLHFEDGIMRVPLTDAKTLEYARVNKHNVGKNRNGAGKYDYYEYDPQEEQRMRLAKQMGKIKLIQTISTMDDLSMKKLAFWFDIKPNDDLGMKKGEDGIRDELLVIADSRPADVQKFIGSKEVEIAYLVRQAIVEAKIDLTAQTGNAMWASGKGFICKIPSTRKAHEYLTELAMTNSDEGRQFKEQLQQIVT